MEAREKDLMAGKDSMAGKVEDIRVEKADLMVEKGKAARGAVGLDSKRAMWSMLHLQSFQPKICHPPSWVLSVGLERTLNAAKKLIFKQVEWRCKAQYKWAISLTL